MLCTNPPNTCSGVDPQEQTRTKTAVEKLYLDECRNARGIGQGRCWACFCHGVLAQAPLLWGLAACAASAAPARRRDSRPAARVARQSRKPPAGGARRKRAPGPQPRPAASPSGLRPGPAHERLSGPQLRGCLGAPVRIAWACETDGFLRCARPQAWDDRLVSEEDPAQLGLTRSCPFPEAQ